MTPLTTITFKLSQALPGFSAHSVTPTGSLKPLLSRSVLRHFVLHLLFTLAITAALTGCGKREAARALDSDANGYICIDCSQKFYTSRDVFASFCPKCKKPNVDEVLGYVCQQDKTTVLGSRARGSRTCPQCQRPISAVIIPRESDLKAWGAAEFKAADVGG